MCFPRTYGGMAYDRPQDICSKLKVDWNIKQCQTSKCAAWRDFNLMLDIIFKEVLAYFVKQTTVKPRVVHHPTVDCSLA